jgi:hypothetical protein
MEALPLSKMTRVRRGQLTVDLKYTIVKKTEPFTRYVITYRGTGQQVYPQFPEYHTSTSAFFGDEEPPSNVYMNLDSSEWLYFTDMNIIVETPDASNYIPIIYNEYITFTKN